MVRSIRRWLALGVPLALAACGPPTTEQALKRAERVQTRAELEGALGRPDEISKLGPVEKWIYKTSDGAVSFVLTGDRVTLSSGGTERKSK